jgi:hypothetical protein
VVENAFGESFMLTVSLVRKIAVIVSISATFAAIGFAAGTTYSRRAVAIETAGSMLVELWYLQQVLTSLERGDMPAVRLALANKAEQTLQSIADAKFQTPSQDYVSFKRKVLIAYKAYREAHADMYKVPPDLPAETKEEWVKRDQELSKFLQSIN